MAFRSRRCSRFENAVGPRQFIYGAALPRGDQVNAQRAPSCRLVTIVSSTTIPRWGASSFLLKQSLRQRVLSPDDGLCHLNDEANSICALPCWRPGTLQRDSRGGNFAPLMP